MNCFKVIFLLVLTLSCFVSSAEERLSYSERDIASVVNELESLKNSAYRAYKERLKLVPNMRGEFVFSLSILPSGNITDFEVKKTSLNDIKLENRLAKLIKNYKFSPANVETTDLEYTFLFTPE